MSQEPEDARKALETTLFDQGKSKEYIEDFLVQYDRNLKNIEDWRSAHNQLKLWQSQREGKIELGETIHLRADENGKPVFHVSPVAMSWLLDFYG